MEELDDKIQRLRSAFVADGYDFDPDADLTVCPFGDGQSCVGIVARHQSATNYQTTLPKLAYYVEGSPRQIGWLIGRMAEPDIHRMAYDYVRNVVFDFAGVDWKASTEKILGKWIYRYILIKLWRITRDVPEECIEEIRGIRQGCLAANPKTKVSYKRLKVLNFGVDTIQSLLFDFGPWRFALQFITIVTLVKNALKARAKAIAISLKPGAAKPELAKVHPLHYRLKGDRFQLPILCNSLSVFGDSAKDAGHYFGRDFMFPTAGVYHKTSAMIIYKPTDGYPFVAQTTPGFVGVAAAMSCVDEEKGGLGIGINLVGGSNTCRKRPGFNSLALARYSIQQADSLQRIVDYIAGKRRGVSYLYPVSDGVNDEAAIIEAGVSAENRLPYKNIKETLLPRLPDDEFLKEKKTEEWNSGIMVRRHDYSYRQEYLAFNKDLFKAGDKILPDDAHAPQGSINASYEEKNCPSTCYFPPQRESKHDVLISTNFYVIPEMRMYSMSEWVAEVSSSEADRMQFRYDDLNKRVLNRLGQSGPMDLSAVQEAITFLRPFSMVDGRKEPGPNAGYYIKPEACGELIIDGSVSVMDLKNLIMKCHYGFYVDEWTQISLKNYL